VDRETKVELAAIPLVLGVLGAIFLVYAAAVGGLWAWIVAGVLIVAAVAAIAYWASKAKVSPPAPPAEKARDGVHRVLVIADGPCGPELPALITDHADAPIEARVLAPRGGSRLSVWTGDEDAYRDAAAHVDETVSTLVAAGIKATGEVGASDPLQTADDGLREFPADEIVFAVTTDEEDRDLLARAAERYAVPVSAVPTAST
jgi:hypothetical protein